MNPYALKPFAHSSHDILLQMIAAEGRPLRILDAGAASGYLGEILRASGHWVAGVESDGQAAEEAARHYDAFGQADLEQWDFEGFDAFDCILFADVLEHLRDPWGVLRRATSALKPGGKFLISIPNVANAAMRLGLLLGRFDYAERGPLDRGHLRFFTRRSLRRMLQETPCAIEEWKATSLPFQLLLPAMQKPVFDPFHAAWHGLTALWPAMFAYQFVVKARPLPAPSTNKVFPVPTN